MPPNLTVIFAFVVVIACRYVSVRRYRAKLPPGPTQLPVFGNLFNFPLVRPAKTFVEWGNKWGDVVSVWISGYAMTILNSPEAASDLLEKKGSIFAEPPVLIFAGELSGYNDLLILSSYERSRHLRRMIHGTLGTRSSVAKLYPIIGDRWMKRFVQRVLKTPDDLMEHIKWMTGAIILEVTYGYQVKDKDDQFIDMVNQAAANFMDGTGAGKYLVDTFHFLRHIPGWVPGFGFQRKAVEYKQTITDTAELPFQYVKDQMMAGRVKQCLVSNLLETEQADLTPEKESLIKWAAASVYAGGADTSQSAIYSFFLIMTLYPDIQRKAHDEVDRVVGNRLPCMDDLPNMPYLRAVISEILRWNPLVSLTLHNAQEDDYYRGYLIPKSTSVMLNVWGLLHDPRTYDDPMTFNPDRFMAKPGHQPETDPRKFAFGIGRRACPGMHLADASTSIACAMSLAVFNIIKAVDENGLIIEPVVSYTDASVSRPEPFQCSIKPRSAKAEEMILSSAVESYR